jgi:hypothetical protein
MENSPPDSPPSQKEPAEEPKTAETPDEGRVSATGGEFPVVHKSRKKPGGRRQLGGRVELYEALLKGFREHPGATKLVAEAAGVARETAARVWNHGWPAGRGIQALRAIKLVLMDESLAVRAATSEYAGKDFASKRSKELLEETNAQVNLMMAQARNQSAAMVLAAEQQAKQRLQDILKKAKLDSAQSIADRAQMLNLGRKSTIAAVALPALVMKDVQVIAKMISDAITTGKFNSPNQAIQAGLLLTRMVEASTRALHNHIMAENLDAGKPTDILALQSAQDERPVAEVEKSLRVIAAALERKKQREALTNGGTVDPTTPGNLTH